MINYYDEIRNDVIGVLEEDENVKEILHSGSCKDTIIEDLYDYLIDCDYVTGNGSGSYYRNSYDARQQCYNYSSDGKEALEEFGYKKELELFKKFEELVDVNYININTMEINYDVYFEEEEKEIYNWYFEEIEELNFETLDVITRCYLLNEVLSDVVNEMF